MHLLFVLVEESPIHEVKFKLPLEESPEIERPELTVNMSRFSNEDPEVAHCGCQTEVSLLHRVHSVLM